MNMLPEKRTAGDIELQCAGEHRYLAVLLQPYGVAHTLVSLIRVNAKQTYIFHTRWGVGTCTVIRNGEEMYDDD